MLAAYDRAMLAALAMPAVTPAQIAARNAAIAAARQNQLAAAANRGTHTGGGFARRRSAWAAAEQSYLGRRLVGYQYSERVALAP